MEFVLYSTRHGYAIDESPCYYHKKLNETGLSWCVKAAPLYKEWKTIPMTFVTLNSLEDVILLNKTLDHELIIAQLSSVFPVLEIYDDYRE